MTLDGLGERVISVVQMPDGRYGVQNERDCSEIRAEDIEQIYANVITWLNLRWSMLPEAGS